MPEQPREEITKLEALYANNPEGRVFTHLAEAYRKAGELDRARSILEQGLTRHQNYASAHVVLGRVLMDQQNTDEARGAFEKVLSLDPHNHVALRSLGDIARDAGQKDEALRYFEELRHLDPNNDEIADILTELNAEAVPEPEQQVAETSAPPPPLAEPVPATISEPIPEPAPEPEPIAELSDLGFEWTPDEEVEEGLPGDLASFAELSAEPEPELPTFTDFGDLDTSMAAEEPAVAEAETAMTDFSFDVDSEMSPSEAVIAEAAESVAEPAEIFFEPDPEFTPPAQEEAEPSGELVTETIAELYTSQGLHDRAADVYRELLKERPNDANLIAKLQEAEAAGRAPIPAFEPERELEPEPQPMPLPIIEEPVAEVEEPVMLSEEQEPEPWLASAGQVTESAPTPYAWTDQSAEAPSNGGPPITDYFSQLLAFTPRERERTPARETTRVESRGFEEPQAPETEAEMELILEEPVVELKPAEPAAAEPMPWEPEPASVPESAPAPATAQAAPASEATTSDAVFDEWFGAPEPAADSPAPAPTAETPAEPGEGDDDDLEMFRSWLQSLKK